MPEFGRNDYDVTNTIDVNNPDIVKKEVLRIYQDQYPGKPIASIVSAFDAFKQLFNGEFPGYHACDTLYHDIQHTLDVTLTTARIIIGYDKSHHENLKLGHQRAKLGIITALFHDAGYIRERNDTHHLNGAEYTKVHVNRSADFMLKFLPTINETELSVVASRIVHMTGYEIDFNTILIDDPKDKIIGHIVGTADLITQMADRCYIEKCRDRLYPEFVLGGIGCNGDDNDPLSNTYTSGNDLLHKTPFFYRTTAHKRLNYHFNNIYKYAGAFFDGTNHYLEKLEANINYLENLIDNNNLESLRRKPPENHGTKVFPFKDLSNK